MINNLWKAVKEAIRSRTHQTPVLVHRYLYSLLVILIILYNHELYSCSSFLKDKWKNALKRQNISSILRKNVRQSSISTKQQLYLSKLLLLRFLKICLDVHPNVVTTCRRRSYSAGWLPFWRGKPKPPVIMQLKHDARLPVASVRTLLFVILM